MHLKYENVKYQFVYCNIKFDKTNVKLYECEEVLSSSPTW